VWSRSDDVVAVPRHGLGFCHVSVTPMCEATFIEYMCNSAQFEIPFLLHMKRAITVQ
jgi:hypothetical protein